MQTFFPFNNSPSYEDSWWKMADLWLSTGVVPGQLNELESYADSTGMQTKVKSGLAWMKGHYYGNDAEVTLPHATADATNPRIDRVILRLDWTAQTIGLAILQGIPAADPAPPALTQVAATKWEIALSQVRVDAGVSTIAANKVTDERPWATAPVAYPLLGANGDPAVDGIAYKNISSYNGAFVTNPTANTYYTVHNGGGSPSYLAVTFTLTKKSTIRISYQAAFRALSLFQDMMYSRFNIKSGASVGGASVAQGYDTGQSYYNGGSQPNPWQQQNHSSCVQLPPGTYTACIEWKTPATYTGDIQNSVSFLSVETLGQSA